MSGTQIPRAFGTGPYGAGYYSAAYGQTSEIIINETAIPQVTIGAIQLVIPQVALPITASARVSVGAIQLAIPQVALPIAAPARVEINAAVNRVAELFIVGSHKVGAQAQILWQKLTPPPCMGLWPPTGQSACWQALANPIGHMFDASPA